MPKHSDKFEVMLENFRNHDVDIDSLKMVIVKTYLLE